MTDTTQRFAGLAGVTLDVPVFDLGEGIELRTVYAHVFSANLVALSRAAPGKPHPAPWRAARGGFGYDIEVQLSVRDQPDIGSDAKNLIWLIAALLRLIRAPYLSVPVISDLPFASLAHEQDQATIEPFELEPRILAPGNSGTRSIPVSDLEWVKTHWVGCQRLCAGNPKFATAFQAFDSATVAGRRSSSSLLALWGGLEQLFSPSPGELRFRVASLISSYLEPFGPTRLVLYKRLLSLYNHRSIAAHTAGDSDRMRSSKRTCSCAMHS